MSTVLSPAVQRKLRIETIQYVEIETQRFIEWMYLYIERVTTQQS